MSGSQQGHFAPADIKWSVEHNGLVLAEVDNGGVSWDFDTAIEAGGSGLGLLKNTYYKTIGPPKCTGKISRGHLDRGDNGALFVDLTQGGKLILQEGIAASAATYTVQQNTSMVSILEIRLNTALVVLREGLDYTVNYLTGVITFAIALPEAATIRYLSSARKSQNLLINGGFEDALTNIWTAFATATLARNAANAFVEGNALAVTPGAQNDGFKYNIETKLQPGRTYRLRLWAKAAAAETLQAFWNDGSSDIALSPATMATLTANYAAYEATFQATKGKLVNITIKDSKASPALFYVDEVALIDDTAGLSPSLSVNPMDGGFAPGPFTFNLVGRRFDGTIVHQLQDCAVDKLGFKSGNTYKEDVSFMALDYIGQ